MGRGRWLGSIIARSRWLCSFSLVKFQSAVIEADLGIPKLNFDDLELVDFVGQTLLCFFCSGHSLGELLRHRLFSIFHLLISFLLPKVTGSLKHFSLQSEVFLSQAVSFLMQALHCISKLAGHVFKFFAELRDFSFQMSF